MFKQEKMDAAKCLIGVQFILEMFFFVEGVKPYGINIKFD